MADDFKEKISLDLEGSAVDGSAAKGAQKTSDAVGKLKEDLQKLAAGTGAEASIGAVTAAAAGLGAVLGELGGELIKSVLETGKKAFESMGDFVAETAKAADEVEKYTIKLATAFGATDTWANSMERAARIVPGLQKISASTGESVDKLATSFRSLTELTGGSNAKVLELTKSLTVMAKTAGFSTGEMVSTIQRAALTGQLPLRGESGREIALSLGLTGDQIKQAQDTGQLIDLLTEKLSEMKDRGETLADTWETLIKSFHVAGEAAKAEIGVAWDPLKAVFSDLRSAAMSDEFRSMAREIGELGRSMVAAEVNDWVLKWVAFKDGVVAPLLRDLAPLAALLDKLGLIKAPAAKDVSGLLVSSHQMFPGTDTMTQLPLEAIKKGREEWEKLVTSLEKDQSLAGLTGIDKQLAEINAKAKALTAEVEKKWGASFTDAGEKAKALADIQSTASKNRQAALDAEAEKQRRIQSDFESFAGALQGKLAVGGLTGLSRDLAEVEAKTDSMEAQLNRWAERGAKGIETLRAQVRAFADVEMERFIEKARIATEKQVSVFNAEALKASGDDFRAALETENGKITEDLSKWAEQWTQILMDPFGDPRLKALAATQLEAMTRASSASTTKIIRDNAVATAGLRGDWASYWDEQERRIKKGEATFREALGAMAAEQKRWAVTAGEGVAAAWNGILAGIQTIGQSTADFVSSSYNALTSGLENAISAVESGAGNLKSVLTSILTDIQKAFAKMVTKLVEEWLLGEQAMAAGGNGRGFLSGTVGGIGGQSGVGREGVYGAGTTQYGDYVGGGGNRGAGGFGVAGAFGGAAAGLGVGSLVGGMSGAPGFGTGAMIGGAVGGLIGLGTGVGASLLTALGPTIAGLTATGYGIIVAAVLAIVGGLIAVLSQPNTEMHVFGRDFAPQIKEVAASVQATMVDVFAKSMLPEKAAFAADLNKRMTAYLSHAQGYEVHAGSTDDIQADIKTLLTGIIPTELLHVLFGQKPTGGMDLAGISGAARYGGELDPNAPINKMLTDLGVTSEKVREIAGLIDSTDPAKFMEFLQNFVGLLAEANDVSATLSKTALERMNDLQKKADETPLDVVKKSVGDVLDTMKAVAFFTGSEQVTRGKAAVDALKNLSDQADAYLEKIRQVDVGIAASISGLISSIDAALTRSGAIGAGQNAIDFDIEKANRRLWGVGGRGIAEDIGAATNLDQVQQYASEATSLITQVFNALLSRMEALQTLEAQFGDLRRGFADPAAAFAAANPDMSPGGLAAGAVAMQREIQSAARMTGQTQIDALAKIRDAGQQAFQGMLSLLKEIADNQKALHASVAAQKDELLMSNMGEQDKAVFLAQKMRDLEAQISTAKNPADIAALTQQIQQYGSQYYSLFKEGDPNRQKAAQYLTDVLDKMQHDADEAYSKLNKTVLDAAEAYKKNMEDANGLVLVALDATALEIDKLKTYAAGLSDIIHDKLMTMAQDVVDALGPLKDQLVLLTGLFTDVTKTIGGGGGGGGGKGGGTDGGPTQSPDIPGVNANLDEFAGRTGDATLALEGFIAKLNGFNPSGAPAVANAGASAPSAVAAVRYYSGRNFPGTGR